MPSKAKTTRHPYAYTLDLLELAIQRLPPGFLVKSAKGYEAKLAKFRKNPDLSYDEIHSVITELGRESWPYRKAYDEMYAQFGHSSEESFLLRHLDEGIREKYVRFINEGGKLNYLSNVRTMEELRRPAPFERYFTPEEKFAIAQALMDARDSARDEIYELLTGKRKNEYIDLIKVYVEQQQKMFAQIDELKHLAEVSDKWKDEMADRIRTIEEGWSVVEQGTDLKELLQETDYWKGTLQAFLKA